MNAVSWRNLSFVAGVCGLTIGAAIVPTAFANEHQIPETIKAPNNQNFLFKTAAKGTQTYICQENADKKFEWTLKGPEAILFDERGKQFGRHYIGPSWEANDGSKIEGNLKAKTDAPQANTISWLLLEAKSHEGNGVFSSVNWIVRLNTVGGQAPVDGCDRDRQNQEISVNYTADYYFYGTPTADDY